MNEPTAASDPGAITAVHRTPTPEDIFAELKQQARERRESEAATRGLLGAMLASHNHVKLQLIALEADGRDRHRLVVDELGKINGRLDRVEGRVTAVERNAFPTTALWSLVAVAMLGVLLFAYTVFR